MFIEINGSFYNLNTVIKYHMDDDKMILYYIDGESEIIRDIPNRVKKLLKSFLYEPKANS